MATEGTKGTEGGSEQEIQALCALVRQTAFELHVYLRHGHLEKVYENGLSHRLRKRGVRVEQQFPLAAADEDGTTLGEYYADLVIEDVLVVELKACKALAAEHTAQMLGYLRASKRKHGMLINFGSPRIEIKKFVL